MSSPTGFGRVTRSAYLSPARISVVTPTLSTSPKTVVKFAVDTGFIVFNDRTYPNFIRLLDDIGQESQQSEMSFSVKTEDNALEYSGSSLNTLFAQRRNILRPAFHRMIRDILRFNKTSPVRHRSPRLLEDTG